MDVQYKSEGNLKKKKVKTLNKQLYQHMEAGFGIHTFLYLVQAALGLHAVLVSDFMLSPKWQKIKRLHVQSQVYGKKPTSKQ